MENFIPCTLKQLQESDRYAGAMTAIAENPVNRSPVAKLCRLLPHFIPEPAHIALLTTKYWGAAGVKLGVSFLDTQDTALKNRILSHMNAWGQYGNVQFSESSGGQVRIARVPGKGYYSYLGTDILHIPTNQQTMNLDSFSMQTPESEYHRVVRHETGHTLGFPHEHMRRELVSRLDSQKTISYFMRTQGWSQQEVIQQVLTPLDEQVLKATPHADQTSIMCYQLPGSITVDGQPITGGVDIDPSDGQFVGSIYPRKDQPPPPPPSTGVLVIDPAQRTVSLPPGWTLKTG